MTRVNEIGDVYLVLWACLHRGQLDKINSQVNNISISWERNFGSKRLHIYRERDYQLKCKVGTGLCNMDEGQGLLSPIGGSQDFLHFIWLCQDEWYLKCNNIFLLPRWSYPPQIWNTKYQSLGIKVVSKNKSVDLKFFGCEPTLGPTFMEWNLQWYETCKLEETLYLYPSHSLPKVPSSNMHVGVIIFVYTSHFIYNWTHDMQMF